LRSLVAAIPAGVRLVHGFSAEAKAIPDPGQRRTLIPGTFAILVLAPN
jgi:hypothetical protein